MDDTPREQGVTLRRPAPSALGEKDRCCASVPLTLPCRAQTGQPGCLLNLDLIWILGARVHYYQFSPVMLLLIVSE